MTKNITWSIYNLTFSLTRDNQSTLARVVVDETFFFPKIQPLLLFYNFTSIAINSVPSLDSFLSALTNLQLYRNMIVSFCGQNGRDKHEIVGFPIINTSHWHVGRSHYQQKQKPVVALPLLSLGNQPDSVFLRTCTEQSHRKLCTRRVFQRPKGSKKEYGT